MIFKRFLALPKLTLYKLAHTHTHTHVGRQRQCYTHTHTHICMLTYVYKSHIWFINFSAFLGRNLLPSCPSSTTSCLARLATPLGYLFCLPSLLLPPLSLSPSLSLCLCCHSLLSRVMRTLWQTHRSNNHYSLLWLLMSLLLLLCSFFWLLAVCVLFFFSPACCCYYIQLCAAWLRVLLTLFIYPAKSSVNAPVVIDSKQQKNRCSFNCFMPSEQFKYIFDFPCYILLYISTLHTQNFIKIA